MPWREAVTPTEMSRIAVIAPDARVHRVLAETADTGVVEPDTTIDISDGGADSLTIDAIVEQAHRTDQCILVAGWTPAEQVAPLRDRLALHGGAVAELPLPQGLEPPTAHHDNAATTAMRPLVTTYGTVPYRDVDPTWFAALAYMLMFGMMFGDVGHGLILALAGWWVARTSGKFAQYRRIAPFLIGAGLAAIAFGFLYGEAFGPTGLVPTLWIRPLDEPETLLLAGLVFGSCLLAITFGIASVNRWREGGPRLALYAVSGLGGALLFAGFMISVVGAVGSASRLLPLGLLAAALGFVLVFVGLLAGAGSGGSAVAQAIVEMFDTVLRMGSNVVSFTRLAAFGLTHAVISEVVWDGSTALWDRGGLYVAFAAALFLVGTAAAIALGALVGGIQALRLEYYEMFSRLFTREGRPFTPWHVPLDQLEVP